jgi:hypothetical protein
MRRGFMRALAATAVVSAAPAFAQTATVNGGGPLSVGDSATIHFGGPAGTTASADLFLQLTGASSATGAYTFSYTFTNANPSVSNLVDFGFTTTPTLLSISGVTGTMKFTVNPINFPGGYNVDACAWPASGQNCDSANGQADSFAGAFTLNFGANSGPISLNNFVDRYASLCQLAAPGSNDCPSGEGTPTTTRPVPEPATWALMLLGFAGVGVAMRRGRKSKPALMQVA